MEQKLLEIINTVCQNSDLETVKELSLEMDLRDDIGLDSLNLAELTVRIEDEFGIDIFEDSIVSTIADIYTKLGQNKS